MPVKKTQTMIYIIFHLLTGIKLKAFKRTQIHRLIFCGFVAIAP